MTIGKTADELNEELIVMIRELENPKWEEEKSYSENLESESEIMDKIAPA